MVVERAAAHATKMIPLPARRPDHHREPAQVRRALAADIPALSTVLARAFDADPFINWFVRQDSRRAQRFTATFDVALRHMSKNLNETFTTTSLDACAIWKRPREHTVGFLEQVELLPAFARVMGWRALPRFSRLLERAQTLHDRLAPMPHFYLFMLGVDPTHQRRGLGSQLLEPMLDRCDADSKLAYLETARSENLSFYSRHGFELAHILDEAPFPKLWLMLRPPSARPAASAARLPGSGTVVSPKQTST